MPSSTLSIPRFLGLRQYGDPSNQDPRYATLSENFATPNGHLCPMSAPIPLAGSLPAPIETLACLHRRYYTADDEKNVLVAVAGGKLYWRLPSAQEWQNIPLPASFLESRCQRSRFSCVSYEIDPEGSPAPVDVLLMSNAADGMLCLRGDDMTVSRVETPRAFGVIARHGERIWGGAIEGDPDLLVYSAPYDPFDWAQNSASPEDGAGEVLQPSWDGDSFTALLSFGGQLLAFKKTRVWRVIGAHPGEYAFKEQYGGGAPCERTVQPDGARIRWQGTLWRASADLWDTPENTPDRAQTLWQALAYREGYRVIPQVIPAEQRFARGECGWWQGALWRSLLEGNVHTPAAYPAGWEEVQP